MVHAASSSAPYICIRVCTPLRLLALLRPSSDRLLPAASAVRLIPFYWHASERFSVLRRGHWYIRFFSFRRFKQLPDCRTISRALLWFAVPSPAKCQRGISSLFDARRIREGTIDGGGPKGGRGRDPSSGPRFRFNPICQTSRSTLRRLAPGTRDVPRHEQVPQRIYALQNRTVP